MTSGWRKRGAGKVKSMNTTQTQVRSTEEAAGRSTSARSALKLALEALENLINQHYAETTTNDDLEKADNAITAIKEALMSLCDGAQQNPQGVSNEQVDQRLELIGHADLAINNIYIFSGYGEEVPEGRTPIYAGYKNTHPPVPYVVEPRTAQPEQEPVAHMNQHGVIHEAGYPWEPTNRLEPLYTTPPTQCNCSQRQPISLDAYHRENATEGNEYE